MTLTPEQKEEIRKAYLADPDADWLGASTPEEWERALNETRQDEYPPYKTMPTDRAESIATYCRGFITAKGWDKEGM